MTKDQLRACIIRRLNRIKADLEQTIRDKRWWNNNRLDAEPFDIGWDVSMLDLTNKELAAWAANDLDAVKRYSDMAFELCKHGEEV